MSTPQSSTPSSKSTTRHCDPESSKGEAIQGSVPRRHLLDCFVALRAPRNDDTGPSWLSRFSPALSLAGSLSLLILAALACDSSTNSGSGKQTVDTNGGESLIATSVDLQKNLEELGAPANQIALTKICNESYSEYKSQPNELKKSAVRSARKKKLEGLFGASLAFKGWVCNIQSMGTVSDGKAHIRLALPHSQITLTNFALFNDDLLISQDDPLYGVFANLTPGDRVLLSGSFMHISSINDYINEQSITELGSMLQPDFIIKCTNVKKVANDTSEATD